jgi:5-methylcytosine-specific restriction protein B
MTNNFSWIPFYKELADNLENWENRQNELIDFIELLRKKNLKVTPLTDKDDQGKRFLLTEIDPFTVFGVFNRGIVEKERIAILSEFKKKFDINSPLPESFSGIPTVNKERGRNNFPNSSKKLSLFTSLF